jgi:O-antigen ligase
LLIWSQVLEIVPDHLWFGIGPDTLMGAGLDGFRRYDPVKDLIVAAPVDLAHNEYLNILISQGVFALAAYLTALVVSAIGWVKYSNRNPVIAACGCSILWYCIQIFFGFSLLFTAPLFWAVWAFMDQEIRRETAKQHTKERSRKKD